MASPGWGAAIGCAVLLVVLNSTLWIFVSQAASGAKRNHLSGIRLPALMKSDEAWHAGHVAASVAMPLYFVAAMITAVLSVPLQLFPTVYVVVLCLSMILSVTSLLVGSIVAVKAAKKI
ncbi:SdpI family protein [Glutamicibacter sp. NPDC087344]|uniref:SdpI family protein n=1 Tax=Glutamicibacter sp. NPDC087344 TaxID=3363994 RepID=UPI0037F6DE3F